MRTANSLDHSCYHLSEGFAARLAQSEERLTAELEVLGGQSSRPDQYSGS